MDDGSKVRVPAGFLTDFGSVPAPARIFIKWSKVDIAGVVHDFLYWCPQGGMSRHRADMIWREVAGSGQQRRGPVRRWLGWLGLLVGGWVAYRAAHRAREAECGCVCVSVPPGSDSLTKGANEGSEDRS